MLPGLAMCGDPRRFGHNLVDTQNSADHVREIDLVLDENAQTVIGHMNVGAQQDLEDDGRVQKFLPFVAEREPASSRQVLNHRPQLYGVFDPTRSEIVATALTGNRGLDLIDAVEQPIPRLQEALVKSCVVDVRRRVVSALPRKPVAQKEAADGVIGFEERTGEPQHQLDGESQEDRAHVGVGGAEQPDDRVAGAFEVAFGGLDPIWTAITVELRLIRDLLYGIVRLKDHAIARSVAGVPFLLRVLREEHGFVHVTRVLGFGLPQGGTAREKLSERLPGPLSHLIGGAAAREKTQANVWALEPVSDEEPTLDQARFP